MSNWVQAQVVAKKQWTEQLFSLSVNAPVNPFIAGQFTKLALDIDDERIARPYSYVNAPDEQPLEFYLTSISHGILSKHLQTLGNGGSIWVEAKAAGFFTLTEVPDAEHLLLFSTGTGIGPFLSILKTHQPWKRSTRIVLVHGVRTSTELGYQKDIQKFTEQHAEQFCPISVISREKTDVEIHGRIPPATEDSQLHEKAGMILNATQSQVMIGRNQDKVRDTTHILRKPGLSKNRRHAPGQITTEHYW